MKQVRRLLGEMSPLYLQKRSVLSPKTKTEEHPEESERRGLAVSPNLLPLAHTLCPVTVYLDFPLFVKFRMTMLRLKCFFGS